jgi:hypothetical protein
MTLGQKTKSTSSSQQKKTKIATSDVDQAGRIRGGI